MTTLFLLNRQARYMAQIGAGQLTSDIDVIGYPVSVWSIDVYPSSLPFDQFSGLNDITVPGTLRDSLILLAVVLEQ